MSVLNDGNNLPGVIVDYEEEQAELFDTTQWDTTDSVLIIGTAHSGASGIASRVYVPEQATYIYGNAYDAKSRTVGTLVPAVQDAYDRGARTIYAMRIGGIDLYKDFRFREGDSNLRLRLSSMYPTNSGKDCFIKIIAEPGNVEVKLYKPATKATIVERRSGIVDSENDTIVTTYSLYNEQGMTVDSKLTELITFFNENAENTNNVLRLSIVDTEGNNMNTSIEAQELRIGSLFSGLYTIGRDENFVSPYTSLITTMTASATTLPYPGLPSDFFRTLQYNTDVNAEYPLFVGEKASSLFKAFQNELLSLSVTTTKPFDFLETTGVIDRIWGPDSKDYEEVDLSSFELYKRLGSGYAITAKAVSRGIETTPPYKERTPRVIETPSSDTNRIVGIGEGIYSTLRNAEVKYRVLVAANADDKIANKLPKAEDFKIARPQSIGLLGEEDGTNALIVATPKFAENDMYMPKKYTFQFYKKKENEVNADGIENLYSDKVATILVGFEKSAPTDEYLDVVAANLTEGTVPNNTQFVIFDDATREVGHLVKVSDDTVAEISNAGLNGELFMVDEQIYIADYDSSRTSDPFQIIPLVPEEYPASSGDWTYQTKQYMLAENKHGVFVIRINDAKIEEEVGGGNPARCHVVPLGSLSTMLTANDDKTLIYAEDEYGQVNEVIITSAATEFMTLEELAAMMNEDSILGKIFTFELTDLGVDNKDAYPADLEATAVLDGKPERWKADEDSSDPITYPAVDGILYDSAQDGSLNKYVDKQITYDYNKYIPYRTSDNFARQLAQHCAETTLKTATTHGIIGLAPIRNLSLAGVAKRVSEVLAYDFSLYAKKANGRYMLGTDNQPYSIGDKISITMFQYPLTDDTNFTTLQNGAAAYAGMVTTLPLTQSSTYQPINIPGIDFRLSNSQLLDLSNKGYIVIRESEAKGLCVTDGTTMAPSSELRKRLSISRICNEVGDIIRLRAEPFIGKNNTQENQNALKTAIDSGLAEIKDQLIVDYRFKILNPQSYTTDAYIDILYYIQPINEIREVRNTIRVIRNIANATI